MTPTATKLSELVARFSTDDEKFEGGNASAGTRARAALQDIKKLCQQRREEIQAVKNAETKSEAA